MDSVAVVTWLWAGDDYRSYKPEYVNVLQSMVARHLALPHKFYCITDMPGDYAPGVNVIPTPAAAADAAKMVSAMNDARLPSCYRRLWLFSEEAKALGDRIFNLDLDCVVLDALDPLFAVDAPFVGYRPAMSWGPRPRVAGGTWLHQAGTLRQVWNEFDQERAEYVARIGYKGSDQAWLSYAIKAPAVWENPGIYSSQDTGGCRWVPAGARLIHFNGFDKPWNMSGVPWIKEHWK